MENLLSLQIGLPEDIQAALLAGETARAEDMIDRRLKRELPAMLRDRLLLQKRMITGLKRDYTLSPAALLAQIRRDIPDFTESELAALQTDGWCDFRYIDGEKRFFVRSYPSMLKSNAALAARARKAHPARDELLNPVIEHMKARGGAEYHFRVRATLRVRDAAFIPGETYRVHLPIPKPAAQQHKIAVLDSSPDGAYLAPETAPQRTAFFEKTLTENETFAVEYDYTQAPRYCDPFAGGQKALYPHIAAPHADDLASLPPHIVFTPYLTQLAHDIAGGETRPLAVARKIYDYITQNVIYSYMRAYLLIENGAEYAALNLRGDCGIQALLFIALCRILGVPARWQSGLYTAPGREGAHDWAQFYVEPLGWLFADCSFGGGAYRAGDRERWDFYFGNLDPFRMVANSAYMQPYHPAKRFLACDPYDNQHGECETLSRGLSADEFETDFEVLSLEKDK